MKTTPITEWHQNHGGKLVEFGGFYMPIDYGSIKDEHIAVRERVGIFDVSHMGEFLVRGPEAAEYLDYLVTNIPSGLEPGQALYSPMCYPDGGTVDDLLIYRISDTEFMMVVNASNIDKDWAWVMDHKSDWSSLELTNVSDTMGLLAIQGPKAQELLQPLTTINLSGLGYYHFVPGTVITDVSVLLSRTGYTGEDGFELYVAAPEALALWEQLVDRGALPIGLGARDTLRLEARLPLYGHELSESITPLEAGLGPFVRLKNKTNFIGRDALERQKSQGLTRKIVGLEIHGGIARAGYQVSDSTGQVVGVVTSGTYSPTLKTAIALALVPLELASIGTGLAVNIRGREVLATVVKTPFYRRT
ncbi:MAG: glycine cleavage system protein T [Sulfobacillus benefaciens]|uniref:Aminomethyltransferase n=1 Tax=Sulfobacillus benefaciens TaxID=453960 RepID=A0A2T2XGL1_9FIRM|nr:MAG: glycine cleavage system protein T [Sulfobacillus benefaciens]